MTTSVITLTFGDVAENHVRMQQIGEKAESGWSCELLESIAEKYGGTIHDLRLLLPEEVRSKAPPASVLVVHYWVEELMDEVLAEQLKLTPDKKCLNRGRVTEKRARYNLCFSHTSQSPDYAQGKGTIIAYEDVPFLSLLKEEVEGLVGDDVPLQVEGNYYYDANKCYIGWHGDAERRRVVGVRLGPYNEQGQVVPESFPLRFRWHHRNEVVGETLTLPLQHGDLYIMSQHAVGTDWMKSTFYVPRHSAGNVK